MMATPARQSWLQAEQRCFQYLKEVIGTVSDAEAYSPEMPATFSATTDTKLWAFWINGAGSVEPIQVLQAQRPACAYNMGATLTGLFDQRETAMDVAGVLFDSLPIDSGEIDGIVRWFYDEMPNIERDEVLLTQDQSAGGPKRVWRLDFSMVVVFTNVRN